MHWSLNISEAQLRLHHDKHHAAYVNGANALFERLDKARQAGTDIDMKQHSRSCRFQAEVIFSTGSSGRTGPCCKGQKGTATGVSGRSPEE